MNLTKEQLLAGAQSNEHGGWRYFYDGKECGGMDEDRVVQRAYVLRQLSR